MTNFSSGKGDRHPGPGADARRAADPHARRDGRRRPAPAGGRAGLEGERGRQHPVAALHPRAAPRRRPRPEAAGPPGHRPLRRRTPGAERPQRDRLAGHRVAPQGGPLRRAPAGRRLRVGRLLLRRQPPHAGRAARRWTGLDRPALRSLLEQLDAEGRIYAGPREDNRSYAIYGEPIHAVADGRVSSIVEGLPDQVPGVGTAGAAPRGRRQQRRPERRRGQLRASCPTCSRQRARGRRAAGAPGRRPRAGRQLRQLDRAAPARPRHAAGPSPVGSQRVPYAIDRYTAPTGRTAGTAAFDKAEADGVVLPVTPFSPPRQVRNALPLDQLVVDFRDVIRPGAHSASGGRRPALIWARRALSARPALAGAAAGPGGAPAGRGRGEGRRRPAHQAIDDRLGGCARASARPGW